MLFLFYVLSFFLLFQRFYQPKKTIQWGVMGVLVPVKVLAEILVDSVVIQPVGLIVLKLVELLVKAVVMVSKPNYLFSRV